MNISDGSAAKLPYSTPVLTTYGDLRAITTRVGKNSLSADGGNGNGMSKTK